jgi:hypothetical protein
MEIDPCCAAVLVRRMVASGCVQMIGSVRIWQHRNVLLQLGSVDKLSMA